MKRMKKTLSVIMALCMVISLLPAMGVTAAAAGWSGDAYTPSALVNGGFDNGDPTSGHEDPASQVDGWSTTATDQYIEITSSNGKCSSSGSITPQSGRYFAELNCNMTATLYQDVETVPGEVIKWTLYHRGRCGVSPKKDTMLVRIGATSATADSERKFSSLPISKAVSCGSGGQINADGSFSTDNSAWIQYSGYYTVPEGQTTTRFAFESVTATDYTSPYNVVASAAVGNSLDTITFQTMLSAPRITVDGPTANVRVYCTQSGAVLKGALVKWADEDTEPAAPAANAYQALSATQSGNYLTASVNATEAGKYTLFVYVEGYEGFAAKSEALTFTSSANVSLDGLNAVTEAGGSTAATFPIDAVAGKINGEFYLTPIGANKLPDTIYINGVALADSAVTGVTYDKATGKVTLADVEGIVVVSAAAIKPEGIADEEELAALTENRLYYLENDIVVTDEIPIPGGVEIEGNGHTVSTEADDKGIFTVAAGKTVTLLNMNIEGGKNSVNNAGALIMDSVTVVNSAAESGILNGATGSLYMNNCVVADNAGSGVRNTGRVYIANSTVTGNGDAGITVTAGAANIVNCIVAYNYKDGAIRNTFATDPGRVSIQDSDVATAGADPASHVGFGGMTGGAETKPLMAKAANGLWYVPIRSSVVGGTETYFDYSDTADVKMGHRMGGTAEIVAGTTVSEMYVTDYIEGGVRAAIDGVFVPGASAPETATYYPVTATAHAVTPDGGAETVCGTVSGKAAIAEGVNADIDLSGRQGVKASQYATLTATAGSGWFFKGWYDPADVNEDGTVIATEGVEKTAVSTSANYKFKVRSAIDLTAVFIPAGNNYIILGNAVKTGDYYAFPDLDLVFAEDVGSISVSFTGAVQSGDQISLRR